MFFRRFVVAASAAATAAATPVADSQANTFGVIAIHSGSGVQNAAFNAAKSSLFAGLPNQNASCARPDEQFATFYIQDGSLFLYDASATPQEIFVDRSGMGQGKIGYTTGAQQTPRNSERKGWAIKDGHLEFDGKSLIACPNSIDGAYSIWVSVGIENPGYNKDCIGIAGRVEPTSNPNGCRYTE
ncbi:hypothetical protein EYZ11_002924 [Aspergillus tanneri]|uniref:Cell wall protein PhiA n=1 Tax=Aspergillus tanneri TaxID=1220188 RepID=A0A4S3JPG8_9EURO|nr:uncharacterized protein ATNIH1004_009530 [Aspergillus tanneri]KAA8642778.1 hypothetical protein ATNIH1004_009530 [Aspergillus tanneri]THC97569.1 hypothetical protein EYZ11_002924 [Aspergillus tanneri]